MARTITSLLLGLLLSGCGDSRHADPIAVDTIFYNGKIVTLDQQLSIASTVVVNNGRIVAVGDEQVAKRCQRADPERRGARRRDR